jgi:DnaK suppressor protein
VGSPLKKVIRMPKRTQDDAPVQSHVDSLASSDAKRAPDQVLAATKASSKGASKSKPAAKTKPAAKASDKKSAASGGGSQAKKTVTKSAAPAAKKEDKNPPSSSKPDVSKVQKKIVVGKKPQETVSGASSKPAPAPKGTAAPSIKVEPKIIEAPQPEFKSRPLDESLFSKDELEAFRGLLLTERSKILEKARKTMEEGNIQIDKNEMFDEVDQAAAMIDQNLTFRLLDRDRKLLFEIDHALAKIDTGDYGYCEGTGEPIPKRRLELRPWCRHSVKYKERLERMKKSGRGVVDEDEI